MKINFVNKNNQVLVTSLKPGQTCYCEATKEHLMIIKYSPLLGEPYYILNIETGEFKPLLDYNYKYGLETNIEATVNET